MIHLSVDLSFSGMNGWWPILCAWRCCRPSPRAPPACASCRAGVLTPFCSCSAVPAFIGFVAAGAPIEVTLPFLIASNW